jgi:TolB-like protein/DNA-binding winged helix-turn-helix (wHTH) protein
MEPLAQQPYCFGSFVLDPGEKVLLQDGRPVSLPPKAIQTLMALVEKHGHVLDKSELLERVWPGTFVEEATLAQNIFTLRKALDDSPDGHKYIETVPKRGYRFVAPVKTLQGPLVSHDGETQPPDRMTARRILPWGLLSILIALTAVGLYFRVHAREPRPAAVSSRVTLAILPFQNLSPDPQQEYFTDGLTEEMITQLGGLNPERLGVIARTSAMHYKGTSETAGQIGQELGVGYLVEGSLRREGSRVRISAQLIRVRDQMHLWAQDYDRDFNDYLALENDVARDIAAQIQLKLDSPALAHPVRPLNPNAYDASIKGRFFWNKRTEEGYLKAIEYFDQAIAADPQYAPAYSGLADAYALLGSNPTSAITRKDAISKARAAALKAISLDDTLAEAHTSLAFVYWHYDWNWPVAEKEFQRALQLNPSYPTAHHWYAFYLLSQGRIEQALEEIRIAQRTDPLSLIINTDVAEVLLLARQYDQGLEQARKVLDMEPRFSAARLILTWCLLKKGANETAVREARKGYELVPDDPDMLANLAIAYAAVGDERSARAVLLQAQAQANGRPMDPISIGLAQAHALLGDKNDAFAVLGKDFQTRNGGLTLIKLLPFFDSLRDDPRYSELISHIGLPP